MKAEIISIGSEITNGQNLDTNSQWLSIQLAEMGIPVGFHITVADDLEDNIDVFRRASERADLVLSSGGLGPTQDDLTREVIAKVAGVRLREDEASLKHIQDMFAKRNRVMPERNRVQALIPEGAEPIFNEVGTASGVWAKVNRAYIAAMPGVPFEMHHMFLTQVKPRLMAIGLSGGVMIQRKINTFGWGESAVEEKLMDITKRGHIPEVGITVSDAVISLRIFGRGSTTEAALAQIAPVEATIRERLGQLVYGTGTDELQHVIVPILNERRLTLAVAEGVTGGLVARKITEVPGASHYFRGGIIAYDNSIKINALGVSANLIETHGTVSREVAEAMAVGMRTKWGTDLALSTVGLAGPDGGTQDKPAGLVWCALASEAGVTSQSINWSGLRVDVQSRAAKTALNLLRLHLLQTK